MAGKEIEKLVKQIAKLPSLGTRSSRRIVLQLLKKRENLLLPLFNLRIRKKRRTTAVRGAGCCRFVGYGTGFFL